MAKVQFIPVRRPVVRDLKPEISISEKGVSFLAGLIREMMPTGKLKENMRLTVFYDPDTKVLEFRQTNPNDKQAITLHKVGTQGTHGRITSQQFVQWLKEYGVQYGRYRAEWNGEAVIVKIDERVDDGGSTSGDNEEASDDEEADTPQAAASKARRGSKKQGAVA